MANENVVAAYARVSTEKENQINSFDNQKDYFENTIKNTDGLEFYKLYGDKGLSGVYWKKRDEFNKMLKDAGIDVVEEFDHRLQKIETKYYVSKREPKFGQIWIKNTARFARNTFSFEIIEKLREKKVYVRFLTQNIYTKDPGQDFILKMMMNMDENESRLKSEATKWGYARGKEKGKIYTSKDIIGYDYDPETNTLKKNKDAKTVKKIFDLYTEKGYGIRKIRVQLNKEGIKTVKGNDYWGYTTIKNILSNEKYYGGNNSLKFTAGEFGHRTWSKPKENYTVEETDRIEPIITKEQFEKAQQIREGKVQIYIGKRIGKKSELSRYAKKLVCHKCGGCYNRNSDFKHKGTDGKRTGKYYFYNCNNKRKIGTKFCNNPNVQEEDLDALVKDFSYGKINDEIKKRQRNYMYLLLKVAVMELDEIKEDVETLSSILKKDIDEKKKKAMNYFEKLIENPELDRHGIFQKKIEELNNEIEELENQLDIISSSNKNIYDNIVIMLEEYEKIKNMDFVLKKRYSEEEVLAMIDVIYVYKYMKKLTEEEIESGYVTFDNVELNRKPELMITFMIYKEAREVLQQYEKKYKFNTENLEKATYTVTDDELNTYYREITEKLERAQL